MERAKIPRCIKRVTWQCIGRCGCAEYWATDYGLRTADQDHEIARVALGCSARRVLEMRTRNIAYC